MDSRETHCFEKVLFRENEVNHWTVYNKVKVVLLSRNKTLLKMVCFETFYRPKIHPKTAQKLRNDHLADIVSKKSQMMYSKGEAATS